VKSQNTYRRNWIRCVIPWSSRRCCVMCYENSSQLQRWILIAAAILQSSWLADRQWVAIHAVHLTISLPVPVLYSKVRSICT